MFYSDKNILNANFNFFKIFGCRLIAGQQISNRTNSNSIRKETKCDKYVKDQLNVAGKNLAKYTLDEKDGRNNLEDIFL